MPLPPSDERPGPAPGRAASDPSVSRDADLTRDGPTPVLTPGPAGTVPDLTGQSIGPYRVLQLIGEGGFGVVYMAQQSAPIRRKVAIKVVKPGMDTRQVVGRFEAERQALAMMDHANIAKVLDGGATPEGRPYFVMELVRGEPITRYCDENRLPTRERLGLFVQVCRAVQHAHQKGIIHRDLKPSNVLVTLHDGTPVPKVIDFGIAKATNQELTEKTVFTEYRQFMGTPEYMSPEQAAMSGLDVDTRTDVYALGVLLYELLTGVTPFDPQKLRGAGVAEVQRMIREDEPPRPSARVGEKTGRPATPAPPSTAGRTRTSAQIVAHQRRTDPNSLRRLLSGELDWIAMKAMEKDRTRRYASAGDLAEDVERHLRNEIITARPPTVAYRARKFARRNRGLLAAGGAVAAAAIVSVAALGYGFLQVRRERNMTAERETVTRAEILLSAMNSVRRYTTEHVRPVLRSAAEPAPDAAKPGDYGPFFKEMVPGFSARTVFDNFRKGQDYEGFVYKEAAPNPTNRLNTADDFEARLVADFREDPSLSQKNGVRETPRGPAYFIARPMRVAEASCLDCHSTPDRAPASMVNEYGQGGFGWKMGDVIAAQVIYVPVSQAVRSDDQGGWVALGALAGALVLAAAAGLVLLTRD